MNSIFAISPRLLIVERRVIAHFGGLHFSNLAASMDLTLTLKLTSKLTLEYISAISPRLFDVGSRVIAHLDENFIRNTNFGYIGQRSGFAEPSRSCAPSQGQV